MVQVAASGTDIVKLEGQAHGRNSQRRQAAVVRGWPEGGGQQVGGKGSEDPLLVLPDAALTCHQGR